MHTTSTTPLNAAHVAVRPRDNDLRAERAVHCDRRSGQSDKQTITTYVTQWTYSIDLNAKSYQNGKVLFSTLKRYIDKVAKFKGQRWNGVVISEEDITKRTLDIAIPRGASPSQVKVLQEAAKYGKSNGVEVNIQVIK